MELRPYQIDLVNRVHESWTWGRKSPCIVLPCGGGKTAIVAEMAKKTTWNRKNVLFLVHRQELVNQTVDTFARWGVDMDFCKIGMVQTLTRHLDTLEYPDLIITDENHHCLAKSYREIYDYFPMAYKVGITATPIRLNGGGLGDVNDELIVGVSAKWLIENGYLSSFDYYAPGRIDFSGLKVNEGEYVAAEAAKMLMRSQIYGDVIKHYRERADGKKAICYCSTVRHSLAMADRFLTDGIPAAHIAGNTPKGERTRIISDFRQGKIQVLCNVDLISEGFDVPDCECAILLRPTKSLTLHIQQSMRCMRYKQGKRAVILDHVGNYTRHGLPDEDREWSLNPVFEKEKKASDATQCPHCFYVFKKSHKLPVECPECGEVIEAAPMRKPVENKNIKLVKVEHSGGFRTNFQTVEDCKTYRDFIDYGKSHGYKPGWAWHMAKARGLI